MIVEAGGRVVWHPALLAAPAGARGFGSMVGVEGSEAAGLAAWTAQRCTGPGACADGRCLPGVVMVQAQRDSGGRAPPRLLGLVGAELAGAGVSRLRLILVRPAPTPPAPLRRAPRAPAGAALTARTLALRARRFSQSRGRRSCLMRSRAPRPAPRAPRPAPGRRAEC
jgi:hypothetical protein